MKDQLLRSGGAAPTRPGPWTSWLRVAGLVTLAALALGACRQGAGQREAGAPTATSVEGSPAGRAAEGGAGGGAASVGDGGADAGASSGAASEPAPALGAGERVEADFEGASGAAAFGAVLGPWAVGPGESGDGWLFQGLPAGEAPAPAADFDGLAGSLFPGQADLFGAGVRAAPLYALSALLPPHRLASGEVRVRFKPAGSGDQAAGIVFGLGADGDYLVLRANGPERNLVLLEVRAGRRNLMAKQGEQQIEAGRWHRLGLRVEGQRLRGQVDELPPLELELPEAPEGRLGLWAVSDQPVAFDDFRAEGGP